MSTTPPPPPPPGPPAGVPPPPLGGIPPAAPPGGIPAAPGVGPGWQPYGPRPASGLAMAAMVLGIVGLVTFVLVIPSLLALIFGLVAAGKIKKSSGRFRLGMARSGWIMGLIGVLGAATLYPLVIIFGEDSKDVYDLDAGDCVKVDLDSDDEEFTELPVTDCTETHNAEVIGNVLLNPDSDRDYPEENALLAEGSERCSESFAAYTGQTLAEMQFRLFILYPQESDWDSERGHTTCIAHRVDQGDLDESIAE